MRIETSQLVEP